MAQITQSRAHETWTQRPGGQRKSWKVTACLGVLQKTSLLIEFQCCKTWLTIHSPKSALSWNKSLKLWQMSQWMTKPSKWPVRPANTQISLGICPVWSELWSAKTLIILGSCPGWSESLLGTHFIVLALSCCGSNDQRRIAKHNVSLQIAFSGLLGTFNLQT